MKLHPPAVAALIVALCLALALAPAPLHAQTAEKDTFQAAKYLLQGTMQVRRDGTHHLLLKAIRQLDDPAFVPLFNELVQSPSPVLKIHGLLGLAECDPERKIDLVRLAAIEDPAVQAEIISAAIDSKLLSTDQAKQIVTWPGMDVAIKTLVAAMLIRDKQFDDIGLLKEGLASDRPSRRSFAAMLLVQMDNAAGMEELRKLDHSTIPERDDIREMLLRAALRWEFERLAPWGWEIANEPGVNIKLGLIALDVSLRFGVEGGPAMWRQQFISADDAARRNRLALVALKNAPHLSPDIFEPLIAGDDALLKQIGQTGAAVARNDRIADEIVKLVEQHHPIANEWALSYARIRATDADAQAILLALVLAFEGPDRGKAQRLDDAIGAAQALTERDPDAAARLLKPIIADAATDPRLVQGLLLALIRSKSESAAKVIEGAGPFANPDIQKLHLLLLAKHGGEMTPEQMQQLSLVVRGGGGLDPSLRLQAAWAYLKRTGQAEKALAAAMDK